MSINYENKFYQILVILNLINFNLPSTMYFVSKSTKTFKKNFWINDFLIKWSKVKVAQLCPTLCNPTAYTVHGIFQARILEWVVFSFSRGSSQPRGWSKVSHIAGGFFTSWAIREAQGRSGTIYLKGNKRRSWDSNSILFFLNVYILVKYS